MPSPNEKPEVERFSDPLDEASQLSAQLTDSAIAAARDACNRPENHPDFDGETCISCGDDIVPARLAMGRIRCTECQSRLELRQKQMGGRRSPIGWPE